MVAPPQGWARTKLPAISAGSLYSGGKIYMEVYMVEKESETPMTKMYVIFESEFPTAQFPEMRERVERLGAHLARISLTNEQLTMFDFDQAESSEEAVQASDWMTIEQWTNNYLLDYLRIHPADRPGTWPTRVWHQIANMVDESHVKLTKDGQVSIHSEGLFGLVDNIKQGAERRLTGPKSRELLFLFARNNRRNTEAE